MTGEWVEGVVILGDGDIWRSQQGRLVLALTPEPVGKNDRELAFFAGVRSKPASGIPKTAAGWSK